jgi:hypothetical protein
MGWTAGKLEGPHSALNLIEFELGPKFTERVIATHKNGGVIYAACRTHDGEGVFALVLLVDRENGLTYTKAMDESMHPFYARP